MLYFAANNKHVGSDYQICLIFNLVLMTPNNCHRNRFYKLFTTCAFFGSENKRNQTKTRLDHQPLEKQLWVRDSTISFFRSILFYTGTTSTLNAIFYKQLGRITCAVGKETPIDEYKTPFCRFYGSLLPNSCSSTYDTKLCETKWIWPIISMQTGNHVVLILYMEIM